MCFMIEQEFANIVSSIFKMFVVNVCGADIVLGIRIREVSSIDTVPAFVNLRV